MYAFDAVSRVWIGLDEGRERRSNAGSDRVSIDGRVCIHRLTKSCFFSYFRTVIMLLVCLFFVSLVVLARESSAKARYTTDALAKETVKVAKTVEKRAGKAFTGW